jgi:hypothetical protein
MDAPMASRLPLFKLPLLVLLLTLSVLLLRAGATHATVTSPNGAPAPFESLAGDDGEEEDEGEGEEEETECEAAEEELEEGELTQREAEEVCAEEREEQRKKAGAGAPAPEECVLRSAHARLIAFDAHDDVRLTVGYTTYEPTVATLDYSLIGGRGSIHLGTAKRHLGKSGVIRLTTALPAAKMDKVDAAKRFVVQLHVSGSPDSCRRFETAQLSVKHDSKSQAVWSQPE